MDEDFGCVSVDGSITESFAGRTIVELGRTASAELQIQFSKQVSKLRSVPSSEGTRHGIEERA